MRDALKILKENKFQFSRMMSILKVEFINIFYNNIFATV